MITATRKVQIIKPVPVVVLDSDNVPVTTKKRVAAYCRVSTDSEEQMLSYDAQVSEYRKKIEVTEDWQLIEIYADAGISGTNIKNRTAFNKMISECISDLPNLKAVATTLRGVKSAGINDWSAVLYYNGAFYTAVPRNNLEVYDRIGGGDSFASGLIFGFLSGKEPQESMEYGAAHGALAMTTPGDTSMASLQEVEKIISGGSARVDR